MFLLGQKVVYPGHGVAIVARIFEKTFGQSKTVFYELQFLTKDMTVMVAMDRTEEVGIRPISPLKHIHEILESLLIPTKSIEQLEMTASNWNRRNKEYQNKLRTGSLKDISEIYRDLKYIGQYKELSFGEKNLLTRTETLLVEEVAAAQNLETEKAIEKVRSFFMPFTQQKAVQQISL